jgi:YidC/Oxa1 family membrane protein insertase
MLGAASNFSVSTENEITKLTFSGFTAHFDALGNLSYYELTRPNYSKSVMHTAFELNGGEKSIEKNQRVGIRYGFLGENESNFVLVDKSKPVQDEKSGLVTLSFVVEDQNQKSPGLGLRIEKKWVVRADWSMELHLKLLNTTDKTMLLYPSREIENNLGLVFGVVMESGYWSRLVAAHSADSIEDLENHATYTRYGKEDWTYLAFRDQFFVMGLNRSTSGPVYSESVAITSEVDKEKHQNLYSAFAPLKPEQLDAGQTYEELYHFYLGEKIEETMLGSRFAILFDKYGAILGGIQGILVKILKFFNAITHNYGWSILLLTLLVKIILLPLNIKQVRSMAKMQQLQPEMKRIQEQYKDDKQRQSQEMMRLYQEHKVNPLGGCLPILLQMPIFFALFYTVGGSVEIYGEKFLWVSDLAQKDSMYIFPVIFVVSFIWSQKKMMADPNQKAMIYILPVLFFFMMQQLPAGVMIYIVGQSLFSNVEQMIVPRNAPVTSGNNGASKTTSIAKSSGKKKGKRKKS